MRRKLILAALLLAAACGGPEPPVEEGDDRLTEFTERDDPRRAGNPFTDLPRRDDFIAHGLLPFGETREEISAALGEPDSASFQVFANRHVAEAQDTLFQLSYPGIAFQIYRAGPGGEFLSAVDVTENRYLLYGVIGDPLTEIRASFGDPDAEGEEEVAYLCRRCLGAEEGVRFLLTDGMVRRVRFSYYVD
jgi:hypothetical protein